MSLKTGVITGGELTADLADAWRNLQKYNPALVSPFFCPEFTRSVAAAREDVEIAMFEDGGRAIGFFPYQRGPHGVGAPVGGIFSDYQGVIGKPEFGCDPINLLRACRLKAWDFDHLIESQLSFAPFHMGREPSPQIDLSRGYEAYVSERRSGGSGQIKQCENLMRRIGREVGPLTFVSHSADKRALDNVIAWKSQQFAMTGKHDLFTLGWTRRLVQGIHAVQTEGFAGVLSLLYAGDRLVAGHFGMRSQTVWHYWFPSYDKEMAKYSPGLLLLLKMAEHAPSVGLRIIDMGKGMSPYKERLMNASVTLASGSVELPSWLSFRRRLERKARESRMLDFARRIRSSYVSTRVRNNLS